MLRDLRHPEGGFFAAEDADSEGIEGKFYLWTLDEIREVCGDDADEVIRYYGVTEAGNFVDPHTQYSGNILHVVDRTAEPSDAVLRARDRLLTRRARRIRPGLDNKVLLAWNALFLQSLDRSRGRVRPRRLEGRGPRRTVGSSSRSCAARTAASLRSWRAPYLAYAEDYAALLEALCSLAEHDDASWLDFARPVADDLIRLFDDEDGRRLLHDRPRRRAARRPAEGRVRQRDAVGELARRQRPAAASPRSPAKLATRNRR